MVPSGGETLEALALAANFPAVEADWEDLSL